MLASGLLPYPMPPIACSVSLLAATLLTSLLLPFCANKKESKSDSPTHSLWPRCQASQCLAEFAFCSNSCCASIVTLALVHQERIGCWGCTTRLSSCGLGNATCFLHEIACPRKTGDPSKDDVRLVLSIDSAQIRSIPPVFPEPGYSHWKSLPLPKSPLFFLEALWLPGSPSILVIPDRRVSKQQLLGAAVFEPSELSRSVVVFDNETIKNDQGCHFLSPFLLVQKGRGREKTIQLKEALQDKQRVGSKTGGAQALATKTFSIFCLNARVTA